MIKANVNYAMVLVIAMAATAVLMVHIAEGAEYVVGDDLGWTIPPNGAADYESWASNHSLTVDDILVFKFAAGEQDLAFVTKEDFFTCNTANPFHVFDNQTTLKFLAEDTFYCTSTLAGHCSKGQKVVIDIGPAADSTNVISPSPSPSAEVPPASLPVKFLIDSLN